MAPPQMMGSAMASSAPKKQQPSFEQLIAQQSSDGFWESSKQSYSIIEDFVQSTNKSDLSNLVKANSNLEQVILTLLALQILDVVFFNKKSEWEMIQKKAKKWIRQQNVDKDKLEEFDQKINAMIQLSDEDELAAIMAL